MLSHLRPPVEPARLVILGARGFVARELATHTASLGWRIRAVGSAEVDLTAPKSADALAELLQSADTLVVVSALTPDRGRDIATLMRNLSMGQHVCQAIAQQPCAHVINIGSDAVYDEAANPVRERSAVSPGSLYGMAHFAREHMFIDTCRRINVPLARLRPSLLYGPGDTHNAYGPNRFARTAIGDGCVALFGEGEEKRDHVFVADVARLIADVARRRSAGVLNIATGTAHSFREVADLVASNAQRPVRIETCPRANPVTHRHFDVSALVAAFPTFRFTSLEEGLSRTMASTA